jgi:hypothetical protein
MLLGFFLTFLFSTTVYCKYDKGVHQKRLNQEDFDQKIRKTDKSLVQFHTKALNVYFDIFKSVSVNERLPLIGVVNLAAVNILYVFFYF